MNDDELKAFEEELASLRPRSPSPRLRAQLDAMVDQQTGDRPREVAAKLSRPAFRWQRYGPPLAIAAGLLLTATLLWWQPFMPEAPAESGPELAEQPQLATAALPPEAQAAAEKPSAYKPVKARNSLRNRIDEGLVMLDSGISARQYRFQFVDTVVWENASDGSQFEVSTPREEIVLVPVHTF